MKNAIRSVIVFCCLTLLSPGGLDAQSWKKDLIKNVGATYKPSKISLWDGSLKEGYDVLVLTQAGVYAWPARDDSYPTTGIATDGKLTRARGADVHNGAREFRKGEHVIIVDTDAGSEKDRDWLRISLLSVESTDRQEGGNTVATRYKGGLDYVFPRGYLATADFTEVKKAINTMLVSANEYKATDVAPTVRLGMTLEEVERVLGKPQKVIDLGTKKIFVYADLKVTFVEGKVSDVQ